MSHCGSEIWKMAQASLQFPALAGLVYKLKPAADAQYLAGLWSGGRFSDCLLWYTQGHTPVYPDDDSNTPKCRPSPCRAPSWSWASVKTAITYEIPEECVSAITIQDVKVIPAGRDFTGEIIYGELKLAGSVVEVSCHSITPEYLSIRSIYGNGIAP